MEPVGWRDPYDEAVFALRYRRMGDFRQAVAELPLPAVVDQHRENLLHKCARLGCSDAVRLLLSWHYCPPDVNVRNVRGETPLHVAVEAMESEKLRVEAARIVVLLVRAGAKVFIQDARGRSVLSIVGRMDVCPGEVLRLVYETAAEMVTEAHMPRILMENGWTIAASFHIRSTVLTLRMMEMSPEYKSLSKDKQKPNNLLHKCLEAECPTEMFEVLLMYCGLEVNVVYNGQTPLHIAAIKNVGSSHYLHMKLLLGAGAKPNAVDREGLRPINYALKNCSPEVFELLVAAGSDVPRESINVAAINGQPGIIRHMLTKSNVNYRCYLGMTPLHYAARERHAVAVYFLLAAGAKVDAVDSRGWTALHHAIRGREDGEPTGDLVPVVGLLLHFGVHVEHRSRDNYTALHVAVARHDRRAMYLLVRHIALHTDQTKLTVNHVIIEKHDGLFELYKKCMQELMRLSELGAANDGDYLLLLRFKREQLIGAASGAKFLSYLDIVPEGGVEFDSTNFSPFAFPIYGNFLLSRVHHANLELMTLEEVGRIKNDALVNDILSLSAREFVEFFQPRYLL